MTEPVLCTKCGFIRPRGHRCPVEVRQRLASPTINKPHPLPLYLCETTIGMRRACDGLAVRFVKPLPAGALELWICSVCGATWDANGDPTTRYNHGKMMK